MFAHEFTVMIHCIGTGYLYEDGPFPDNADDQTKDRLWKAVKAAVDIFEKIPRNLCTTCNVYLAWCDTTTCPECSFAAVETHDPPKDWSTRVMPQAKPHP